MMAGQNSIRRCAWLAVVLLGASACLPALPTGDATGVAEPAPARTSSGTIRIGKALRGDLTGVLTFVAPVRAKGEVAIVPRVTARVDRVMVDMGSRVRAGDTLAELDRGELELQVLAAQAGQASAEAKLAELKAGPKTEVLAQAEANQRAAQARVRSLESARSASDAAALDRRVQETRAELEEAQTALKPDAQRVTQAEAEVTAARNRVNQIQNDPARANDRAALDAARADLQRAETALTAARTPGGSQAAVETARRDVQDAEQARLMARLSTTAFDLDQARALLEVANAQVKLVNAEATEEEIRAAESAVEQAHAQAELARLRLRETTITAPIAGIVTEIRAGVGSTVAPGATIMTIIPPEMQIVVQADESLVPQLQVGQIANVSVESYPKDAFSGTVKGIAPVLDPRTRSVAVQVDVSDPQGKLRPGMFTQLGIQTGQRQSVLMVPREAVLKVGAIDPSAPPQNVVYTVSESRVRRTVVGLGVSDGKNVEIVQGLAEGVDLVLNPRPDFLDGELISS